MEHAIGVVILMLFSVIGWTLGFHWFHVVKRLEAENAELKRMVVNTVKVDRLAEYAKGIKNPWNRLHMKNCDVVRPRCGHPSVDPAAAVERGEIHGEG